MSSVTIFNYRVTHPRGIWGPGPDQSFTVCPVTPATRPSQHVRGLFNCQRIRCFKSQISHGLVSKEPLGHERELNRGTAVRVELTPYASAGK